MRMAATAFLLACLTQPAIPAELQLNETQRLGRQLYEQHCGVCHTRPTLTANLYGPELSRETAGGNEEVVGGIITNGTPRMPAFRHMFDAGQIAAIAAYLKILPPGHQASVEQKK
jgi:mono/diheme cytochrome c family protein